MIFTPFHHNLSVPVGNLFKPYLLRGPAYLLCDRIKGQGERERLCYDLLSVAYSVSDRSSVTWERKSISRFLDIFMFLVLPAACIPTTKFLLFCSPFPHHSHSHHLYFSPSLLSLKFNPPPHHLVWQSSILCLSFAHFTFLMILLLANATSSS